MANQLSGSVALRFTARSPSGNKSSISFVVNNNECD
jgi:hypothetical protein